MASAEGGSRKGPNWLALPRDVTENILQRLRIEEIMTSASLVCSLWWNICKEPLIWRTIAITHPEYSYYNLVDMCAYAIRRSSGHLQDIRIDSIATDDLLMYIANSTSVLRRLCLEDCDRISDIGMIEAVKKFPLLEELDISLTNVTKDSLEVIGRCCPLLKTLKFNQIDWSSTADDNEAFAIATTMPGLRYLQITNNTMSNDGLLAILDGCPLLEFLDLRFCSYLDLSGSLGDKCKKQIKHVLLST